MNTITSKARPNDRALDLVGAFVESSDARLRGNAIQALVALVNGEDSDLANRAEETLAQAIVSGPASAETEWQRRFRARALDAMEHLVPAKRSRTFEHVLTTHRRSKDVVQRAALANFLLEANSKGLLARPANWFELRRLTRSLATVGFLRATWQASWRFVLAAIAIFVAILLTPFVLRLGWELDQNRAISEFLSFSVFAVVPLVFLPLVTPAGRLELSLRERIVEAAMGAIVFAAIAVLGTTPLLSESFLDNFPQGALDFLAASGLGLAILGAVTGAAVRLLKWLSDTELTTMYRAKLLLAVLVVTLVGMSAAQCGMDPKVVGAAWVVLAPSAVAAASLDGWLEGIGPNLAPLVEKPQRTRASLLIVAIFMLGCAIVLVQTYRNFSRAAPSPDQSAAEMSDTAAVVERSAKPPHRLELNVTKQGKYTVYAAPGDETTDIVLTIQKKGERAIIEDHNRDKQSEESTIQMSEGKSFICVAKRNQPCNYEIDLIDFAAALVAGEPIMRQDESLDLNIKIFPADKRPASIPAAPATRSQSR